MWIIAWLQGLVFIIWSKVRTECTMKLKGRRENDLDTKFGVKLRRRKSQEEQILAGSRVLGELEAGYWMFMSRAAWF